MIGLVSTCALVLAMTAPCWMSGQGSSWWFPRIPSSKAFTSWKTAKAQAEALAAEVASAEIALEGVEQEALVGARTVLDVLDAEQERLSAQVRLVRANRDTFVAAYSLLSAIGKLTAKGLELPVEIYDYDKNFMRVRTLLYGER